MAEFTKEGRALYSNLRRNPQGPATQLRRLMRTTNPVHRNTLTSAVIDPLETLFSRDSQNTQNAVDRGFETLSRNCCTMINDPHLACSMLYSTVAATFIGNVAGETAHLDGMQRDMSQMEGEEEEEEEEEWQMYRKVNIKKEIEDDYEEGHEGEKEKEDGGGEEKEKKLNETSEGEKEGEENGEKEGDQSNQEKGDKRETIVDVVGEEEINVETVENEVTIGAVEDVVEAEDATEPMEVSTASRHSRHSSSRHRSESPESAMDD